MRNVVCTSKAPGVGPYSQAVRGGGFIFVSGQLALDPVTRQIIEGDARQQTERALQNIAAVLEASGSNLDKVVRCGVFLKNMSDYKAMNDVYGKIFGRVRADGSNEVNGITPNVLLAWAEHDSGFQRVKKLLAALESREAGTTKLPLQ